MYCILDIYKFIIKYLFIFNGFYLLVVDKTQNHNKNLLLLYC